MAHLHLTAYTESPQAPCCTFPGPHDPCRKWSGVLSLVIRRTTGVAGPEPAHRAADTDTDDGKNFRSSLVLHQNCRTIPERNWKKKPSDPTATGTGWVTGGQQRFNYLDGHVHATSNIPMANTIMLNESRRRMSFAPRSN